ncbi:hypothetical protein R6Q59_028118 [Mikania micrantha]
MVPEVKLGLSGGCGRDFGSEVECWGKENNLMAWVGIYRIFRSPGTFAYRQRALRGSWSTAKDKTVEFCVQVLSCIAKGIRKGVAYRVDLSTQLLKFFIAYHDGLWRKPSHSAQTRQLKRKCQEEEEVCDHGSPFRSKLLVKRVCLKSRTETLKWVRRRKGRHGWRKEKVKKFSARCEAGMEKRGREHQKG